MSINLNLIVITPGGKMHKRLKPSGNGWVLYFSKPMLQLLGYNPKETNLLITSDNKIIYVEPIEDLERYKNNMVKKLQRSSNSYGLYFTQPLIEILEINPEEDLLEIDVYGNKFTIRKLQK